jgi:hypothetical protein
LRDAVDLGLAPGSTHLDRVILLLEPSPAQQRALDAELESQQTPGSCAYHAWLTPQQFADRFATLATDVNTVADWLNSEGFNVAALPASHGWIEFSGTAAQVAQAFGAPVHAYSTTSGTRLAVSGAVSVPAALSPVIHGLASLDGDFASAALTTPRSITMSAAALAAETNGRTAEALTPKIAAQVMHLVGLPQGAGESIAIAARSNIQPADLAAFRATFGLPPNPVFSLPSGPDPGLTADQAEAEFTASWAGAAAPAARIVVVPARSTAATDGIDLSLATIVDQSLANTVIIGFSACEAALSETHRAFYATLYRQAAAQGISTIAATGDSGAAACHPPGSDSPVTTGYAVNALASTPWNTSVGAIAFAPGGDSPFSAWSPLNARDPAYAGGGGQSSTYGLPAWQSTTASASARRMLPDITLPTGLDAAVSRGLAFCFSGSGPLTGCNLVRSGGSAAAAAIFGGVSAAIAQENGPQGNLAPRLYALRNRAGVFTDVQEGTARLACASGSPGCDTSGMLGYVAAKGYDLATGLGVPDAFNLLAAWPETGTNTPNVALGISPTQSNATYNPQATLTFTATVTATQGTPTGSINFLDQTTGSNLNSVPYTLDSSGTASATFNGALPQGGNNIVAQYSGDSTYSATSSQVLTVNIQPSTTVTTVTPSTTTPAVGVAFPVTVTVAVGTPPAGAAAPTGKVNLTLDGAPFGSAAVSTTSGTTSASFNVTVTSGGGHNLQAVYAGDANFESSTSAAVTVTASKGATVTTLIANPTSITAGTPETFTATIAAASSSSATTNTFTGTVTFFDGTSEIGTATVSGSTATLSNITLSASATHSITAVYGGDGNWVGSTSNIVALKAGLIPVTVTLTASPTTAGPGQVVTLLATVAPSTAPAAGAEQNPTGNIVFYNGTAILGTVPLSAAANNTSTAQLLFTTLPAGQDTLTAVYLGDLYYGAATSNAVTIAVKDFTITPSPNNPLSDLDIVKGASGQVSYTVTGLGGFNSAIALTCAVPAQDDMTCTPNPATVAPKGTVTFTVTTFLTGATTARMNQAPLWPRAAGGAALAVLVFFLLPFGRRARIFSERSRRTLTLLLLLAAVGAAGIGCSSVSGSAQGTGTPLGETVLTITGAANVDNTVVSHSIYLTVNVLPSATGTSQPVKGAN